MRKGLLRLFIFFTIIGILFSNAPFYALTGAFNTYIKTRNVVDKSWELSKNENIVDKFTSYRNLSERIKIHEAYAAVSIRNVGAYTRGTANLTPAIPATAASGDMMLLFYGTKPYNDAPTITAGWNLIGSATDGTVAAGTDLGSMQTRVYYKEHTGTESAPTVTNGTNNSSGAVIIAFQKGATETWATPVGAGGGDATAGTGFSVTASANPGITAGDMLVGYASIRSDAGTQSAIGITATGATVGAFTESPATDLASGSGGDMAMSGGYRSVTAGTASAAPIYASTLAAAHTGSAFIVRLRPIPNNPPSITVTQPDGVGDSVTVGASYNITYDLSDTEDAATVDFYYDTDAVGLNGTAIAGCQNQIEGAGATCAWDTTGMTPGAYYIYGIADDTVNATTNDYSPGQITINAPAGPDATSISYQVGGDGGRSGYSATISGSGFGTVAGGSRASCAGGAGTGCIRFTAGGNATVADGDITAWTDTSISFNVNAALASEGGASNIEVVAAGTADTTKLTFYVYPTISGFTAAQTDGDIQTGTITISGDHLGATGATTNISFNGTNPGSIGAWTSTSIPTVDIPNAGTDSGTITITRASDGKASNASATFYIYPQLTGYTGPHATPDEPTENLR